MGDGDYRLRHEEDNPTRDSGVMKRCAITTGRVKAVFVESDNPEEQLKQLAETIDLSGCSSGFLTRCLECNRPLEERTREQVGGKVPAYVYETQDRFMECPSCNKVTGWALMAGDVRGNWKKKIMVIIAAKGESAWRM
jgi:uncharacterized protein with PIN domain